MQHSFLQEADGLLANYLRILRHASQVQGICDVRVAIPNDRNISWALKATQTHRSKELECQLVVCRKNGGRSPRVIQYRLCSFVTEVDVISFSYNYCVIFADSGCSYRR